jgi:amino acid permease
MQWRRRSPAGAASLPPPPFPIGRSAEDYAAEFAQARAHADAVLASVGLERLDVQTALAQLRDAYLSEPRFAPPPESAPDVDGEDASTANPARGDITLLKSIGPSRMSGQEHPPQRKGALRKSLVEHVELEAEQRMLGGVGAASTNGPGASLSSSVVNMANTVMGVGLLALPRAFAHSGLVWGLLLTTFAAGLNIFTCHLIARCQDVVGRPCSFRDLADRALPYFSVVIDLSVLVLCLGTACSYLIVATNCFQFVAGTDIRWVWTLLALALVAPLSFLRSMDSLRFSSAAAIFILLFMTLVIVLFATHSPNAPLIDACGSPAAHNDSCPPGPVDATQPVLPTLSAFSSLSLAFSCQATAPIIGNEIVRPTTSRLLAVFAGAIGLAWTLYTIVAVSGYSTFGDRVQANILDSYPDNGLTSITRVGLAFVVIFSYPIQTFVTRLSITSLVRVVSEHCCPANRCLARLLTRETSPATKRSRASLLFELEPLPAASAFGFLLLTTLVALTVQDLGLIVDLAGAVGATMISFITPAVLYIRLVPMPRAAPLRIASIIVAVFGVCSLLLGLVLALDVSGAAGVHHPEIHRPGWALNVSSRSV